MQAKHAEAEAALRQAHGELIAADEHVGAARCLISLGEMLRMRHQHADAVALYRQAHS